MVQYAQASFETGEVGDGHIRRVDLKVRASSVERARNVRIRVSGILEERPSTARVSALPGFGLCAMMVVGDDAYVLVLSHQRFDVWDKDTRALVQSVTGCAWTLTMLQDAVDPLLVDCYANQAWVYHPDLATQRIERSDAGVWSAITETFADGLGGSLRQPYYRFANDGVTLTPSALTGAGITLQASATGTFVTGHDELRLTLQGREVQVKAYIDGDTVSADVIQRLHPTVTLAVESSDGFDIGSIVDGRDSFARAEVTASGGGSLTLLMQEFTGFAWDAGTSLGETITGPNGSTKNTGAPTGTSNAAVLDWQEQAISALRGYPSTGAVHKNRRWMARLPEVKFGVLASAYGDFRDYAVGVNDQDAIFEELGDANAGVVRHVFSSEQLLFFTDRGLYYYPESEQNPIRPTSFQVLKVGPDGASNCRPVQISEGVMFAEAGGKSVLGAFPTGDVRRSWRTADVSLLSAHLINDPVSMAYVSGSPVDPERYVYSVNADGTMAVVYYSDSAEIFGWTLWDTTGEFRNVCSYKGECWTVVERLHDETTVYSLEVFDPDRYMDGAVTVDSLQGAATSETIQTPSGVQTAEFVHRFAGYANATCSLMQGGLYIGEVTLDADGDFGVLDIEGAIELGFKFECRVKPWPPAPPEDPRATRRVRRITRVGVRWRGRYMAIDGDLLPIYRWGEDTTAAPPVRDEFHRQPVMKGWSEEQTVEFTRPYPGPWSLLEYVFEVKE